MYLVERNYDKSAKEVDIWVSLQNSCLFLLLDFDIFPYGHIFNK